MCGVGACETRQLCVSHAQNMKLESSGGQGQGEPGFLLWSDYLLCCQQQT